MNLVELINDSKTTIVDVRTTEEFLQGNVKGSINIPLHEIVDRVEELKRIQPLVLCCLSGGRSGKATKQMKKMGFTTVYNLIGGIGAWDVAGNKKVK